MLLIIFYRILFGISYFQKYYSIPMTSAIENIFLSHATTAAIHVVLLFQYEQCLEQSLLSLLWLVNALVDEALNGFEMSVAPPEETPQSPQLVPYRFLYARPLMKTVFSALHGLLFEPLCKRIALNVFSTALWFWFLVSSNLNLRKVQVVTLSTELQQYSMRLTLMVRRQKPSMARIACNTNKALKEVFHIFHKQCCSEASVIHVTWKNLTISYSCIK